MPTSRKPALLRGFASASLAIFVALAGHVSAGAAMPGLLGIAVPWLLSFMVCVLLAGRKLSVIRLSASVGVSQFLFHALFVLGTITPAGGGTGHVHGAALVLPGGTGVAAEMATGSAMWLGHAGAALLTIVALHRGERMLIALRDLAVQLIGWLRRRLQDAVVVSSLRAPRLTPVFEGVSRPEGRLLATLRGRAPPTSSPV